MSLIHIHPSLSVFFLLMFAGVVGGGVQMWQLVGEMMREELLFVDCETSFCNHALAMMTPKL